MHRPGRSNISARLTSFAPSSSQRMWEPINPSERDSFAREIADLPRSFNRDRDSFIISFDALGIFYPEREEGRFEDSLVCVERLFFNLSRTFKNEDEEDSPFRVIVPEFLYSSIIYLLFSSLEISTKILEKRTRKRRGERIDPPTPPSLFHTARLHKAWIRKWNFFSSSRKRNLFIEGIHSSESWAREQRFSIGVEERKRWIGDEKRVSNARALPPRGGESQTTSPPLQRFLLPSPIPVSFHRVKNLGDFSTSSAHVAAPLKGEDSNFSGNALCGVSSVRLSRSFHESHDLRASLLLRVHTPCSSSSCAHTSVPRKMSICRANDSRLAQYAPGWLSTLDSTRKRERDRERGFLCSSRHGLVLPIP